MELVKCGRCGVSLTPASCFPPGSRQPRRAMIFLLFSPPRSNTRAHARTHMVVPFRGVTRRWRQYSSAQFPILEKTLFKRPRYFFVIPHATGRRGGSGAISFATRTTHLPMTISCVEPVNLMDPIVPSGLFMQERVSFNTRCQSYNILPQNKICQNILSSILQTDG